MPVKIRVARHVFHRLGFDDLESQESSERSAKRKSSKEEIRELERALQDRVRDFMVVRQWRHFRNTTLRAVLMPSGSYASAGEPGIPDDVYVFRFGTKHKTSAAVLQLWIEAKIPGSEDPESKRRKTQVNWQERERALGAEIWTINDWNLFQRRYYEEYGWLHSGNRARGQTELFGPAAEQLFGSPHK